MAEQKKNNATRQIHTILNAVAYPDVAAYLDALKATKGRYYYNHLFGLIRNMIKDPEYIEEEFGPEARKKYESGVSITTIMEEVTAQAISDGSKPNTPNGARTEGRQQGAGGGVKPARKPTMETTTAPASGAPAAQEIPEEIDEEIEGFAD